MKKILLSVALLASAIASAQVTFTDTTWKIDFAGWTDKTVASVAWAPGCDGDNSLKTYTADTIKNGGLEIKTTGEQEGWEKVTIAIVDVDGFPITVDLSNNKTAQIVVETSVAGVEFLAILGDGKAKHCAAFDRVLADNTPAIITTLGQINTPLSLNSASGIPWDWKVFPYTDRGGDACYPAEGQYIDSTTITTINLYFRNPGGGDNNGCAGGVGKSIAGTFKIKSITLGESIPDPFTAVITETVDAGNKVDVYEMSFVGAADDANVSAYANVGFAPGCDDINTNGKTYAAEVKNGALEITTTGEQKFYEHVEIKIVDALGNPKTLDLSHPDKQGILIELESDVAIEDMMVVLADEATIHCDPTKIWQVPADNNPVLKAAVPAGVSTITNLTDDIPGNDYGVGGFDWKVFATPDMLACYPANGQFVDSTKVSEIWVYFRKAVETDNGCDPISGGGQSVAATVKIKRIVLGQDPAIGFDEFVSNEATFSVFPNPVSEGVINFSENLDLVELYNVQGNLVRTVANTNKMNVKGLDAGMYIIQSSKGYKRVVIK